MGMSFEVWGDGALCCGGFCVTFCSRDNSELKHYNRESVWALIPQNNILNGTCANAVYQQLIEVQLAWCLCTATRPGYTQVRINQLAVVSVSVGSRV